MAASPQDTLDARLRALDPALYPFEHHYLDRAGLKLHYLDEGPRDAAPVVMVHGNPTWSIYYRELVKALRPTHRCIVPDHIGMGFSDKPADGGYAYTLKNRIHDLERLLEHLGVKADVTLVVHDWGGMIGCGYAVRHPERIARLVVLNTGAFHLPKAKAFPWPLWLTRTPLGALLVRGFNMFSWTATKVCCKRRPMPAALAKAFRAPYDSWAHRIATLRFVQDIPLRKGDVSYDEVTRVEEGLAALADKPMQLYWGLRDFVFDKPFLDEFQRRFPAAQASVFDDGGHYILEDARDEIIAGVRAFLETPARREAPDPARQP